MAVYYDQSFVSGTLNDRDIFDRHPLGLWGFSMPYYKAYITDASISLADMIEGKWCCHSVTVFPLHIWKPYEWSHLCLQVPH